MTNVRYARIAARMVNELPPQVIEAIRKAYGRGPKTPPGGLPDDQAFELVKSGRKPVAWIESDFQVEVPVQFIPAKTGKIVFLEENRDIANALAYVFEHKYDLKRKGWNEWDFVVGVLLGYPIETMFGKERAQQRLQHIFEGVEHHKHISDEEKQTLDAMQIVMDEAVSEYRKTTKKRDLNVVKKLVKEALSKAGYESEDYEKLWKKLHIRE